MAQTSSAAAFDYSAINLHMAKQLVKDLLEAFDAEGNRTRLARALVTAQEKTDALMLTVTPLAVDIASEALQRWGIVECEGDAFVRVMERISLLAPRDEELSYDVYQLKQKFLPVPPTELLEAEAKRVKEELRQKKRMEQQAKEEAEAAEEARKKAEARQFARETFGEGTTASAAYVYGHGTNNAAAGVVVRDDKPDPWKHKRELEAQRKTLQPHELDGLNEASFAQRQAWNPKGGSYPPLDTSGYGPIQEALKQKVGDAYVRVLSPSAGAALKKVGAAFRESDKGWGGRGYSLSENQGRRGIPFHRVGTGELTPSGEHLRGLVSHEPFDVVEDVVRTLVGDEFLDDSHTRLLVANPTRGGVLSQGPHADAVVVHKHKVEEEETHEQLRWLWMSAMAVICFVVSFENGNYGIPREGPLFGIFACVTLELPASAIYALTALLAGQKPFGFVRIDGEIYKLRIYHLVFGIKEQRALTVASVLVPLGGAAAAIAAADRRIDALARRLSCDDVLTVAELFPLRVAPCVVGAVSGLLGLGGGSVLCYGGAPAGDADALAAAVVLPAEAKKLRRENRRAADAAREALRDLFVRSGDARGARALLGFSGHDTAAHDAGANALADLETLVEREARRDARARREAELCAAHMRQFRPSDETLGRFQMPTDVFAAPSDAAFGAVLPPPPPLPARHFVLDETRRRFQVPTDVFAAPSDAAFGAVSPPPPPLPRTLGFQEQGPRLADLMDQFFPKGGTTSERPRVELPQPTTFERPRVELPPPRDDERRAKAPRAPGVPKEVCAAMDSALGRLERRLETPDQREARLAPARERWRDARDALREKHGSFCRCKNSKCLKRYCECFERGVLCGDSCKCENCENIAGSASLREARAAIAELPPSRDGCTCKNSRCLKLYCVCFKAGSKCVAACKCVDCQNGRPADAPIPAPPKKRRAAPSKKAAPPKKRQRVDRAADETADDAAGEVRGGLLLNAARLAALREEYARERERAAAGATPSPPSQ